MPRECVGEGIIIKGVKNITRDKRAVEWHGHGGGTRAKELSINGRVMRQSGSLQKIRFHVFFKQGFKHPPSMRGGVLEATSPSIRGGVLEPPPPLLRGGGLANFH